MAGGAAGLDGADPRPPGAVREGPHARQNHLRQSVLRNRLQQGVSKGILIDSLLFAIVKPVNFSDACMISVTFEIELINRAVKFSYTWGLLSKDHNVKFLSTSQSVRELDGPVYDKFCQPTIK